MIPASEVKSGMILQIEKTLYKVLSSEYHMSGGKMGGVVHIKLKELRTSLLLERKFRPEEKLNHAELERKTMEFLYRDTEGYYMMDPDTYEQIQLERHLLEAFRPFLQPNMKLPVEFLDGEAANVVFPDWVILEVTSTLSSISSLTDEVYKPATLSNGMQIQVPQFIRVGDFIKVSVTTKKYIERVKR